MVMEYVDGKAIDKWCRDNDVDARTRLRMLVQLCAAVAHAHARLVLHRDIKASNVLVDSNGDVRLIDFGISALTNEERSAEAGGPLTVATAAPEQLAGEGVSSQTDVFAIGLLAHQLLAGRLPARSADRGVVLDPSTLRAREVVSVLERATRLVPEDRYASADALSEDFLALLEHRPVSPLRRDLLYRLRSTLRRYPVASALAATASLALVVGAAVSMVLADRAATEAARARDALAEARFYLERAELTAATQSAYSDALQRMFGDEADEPRMRRILIDHAHQALAQYKADPARAAQIAYAVGRHFVDRNDYAAGLEVLEPWLTQGYGHPHLLRQGRLNQALAYRYTERHEEALALFNEVDQAFMATPDQGSVDHLVAIVQRAELLSTREAWSSALSVLKDAVAQTDDAHTEMFCWAYIDAFEKRLGNFAVAYEAARRAVAVFERHPLLELHGRVNTRSMLASYEIYYTSDYDAAVRHIEQALADAEVAGETGAIAELIYLRGESALFQGELEETQRLYRRPRAMELEYFPVDVGGTTSLVEALAEAGELPEAERELDQLAKRMDELRPGGSRHPRITLARARLAAARDGAAAAQDTLAQAGFTRSFAATSIVGMARVKRLEALGVEVPD